MWTEYRDKARKLKPKRKRPKNVGESPRQIRDRINGFRKD